MSSFRYWILLILSAIVIAAFQTPIWSAEDSLSKDDIALFENLLKSGLWDPLIKGENQADTPAARVRVSVMRRSCWGYEERGPSTGWMIPKSNNSPAQVLCDNLQIVPADDQAEKVDLDTEIKALLHQPLADNDPNDEHHEKTFRHMRDVAEGNLPGGESKLAWAVWLWRLGKNTEAAQLLRQARKEFREPEKMLEAMQSEMAWRAFSEAANAYILRADAEALLQAERLNQTLLPFLEEHKQGKALLTELLRRQKDGHFFAETSEKKKVAEKKKAAPAGDANRAPLPDGYADWPMDKKLAFLIRDLEEVDERQMGQPGGVDLAADPRVQRLIELGNAAVPALIDCVEKDRRLTRSMHFWRDFSRNRTILSVREAALTTVMSILRVTVFAPGSTGDNFTAHGEEGAANAAAQLRKYWDTYGKLTLEQRMQKVLLDKNAGSKAWQEAAGNLASMAGRSINTTVFVNRQEEKPIAANPALKLENPTAAEAILQAMDWDLAAHDNGKRDDLYDYTRRQIEAVYTSALGELKDGRIAPELSKRCEQARADGHGRMRRQWAMVLYRLHHPEAFQAFAQEVEQGKLKVPANDRKANDEDQPGNVELRGIVGNLVEAGGELSDRTLNAMAQRAHPLYAMLRERILNTRRGWGGEEVFFLHPYCLEILRRELEHTELTGRTISINGDSLEEKSSNSSSTRNVPEDLRDPQTRNEKVEERVCDATAMHIADLAFGVPKYHPLYKDAPERLAAMRVLLDRFAGKFKRITDQEFNVLKLSPFDPHFAPVLPPLGQAATEKDVAEKRAIFELNGAGKPANIPVDRVVHLKKFAQQKSPPAYLILQAETDKDGTLHYGVLGNGEVREITQFDIADPKADPVDKKF